jgi:hypothetical protein
MRCSLGAELDAPLGAHRAAITDQTENYEGLLSRQDYKCPSDLNGEPLARLASAFRLRRAPMAVRVVASAGRCSRSDLDAKSDLLCPLRFMTAPLTVRSSRTVSISI